VPLPSYTGTSVSGGVRRFDWKTDWYRWVHLRSSERKGGREEGIFAVPARERRQSEVDARPGREGVADII
jgi:hypothetical protein